MSHEDSMPFQVKEMFRQGLKNKETVLRLFDDARKIVKKGIVDARKILNDPSSDSLELSHAVTTNSS